MTPFEKLELSEARNLKTTRRRKSRGNWNLEILRNDKSQRVIIVGSGKKEIIENYYEAMEIRQVLYGTRESK